MIVSGAPAALSGTQVQGYRFSTNGTNQSVACGTGYNPDYINAWTIAFWFQFASNSVSGHPLSKQNTSGNTGLYTYIDSGRPQVGIQSPTGSIDVRSSSTFGDGKPHLFVFTNSGSGRASGLGITVDDAAQSLTTLSDNLSVNSTTTTDITLGCRPGAAGFIAGVFSQIGIWSKALNSSEKTAIYAGRNLANWQSVGPTANLVRYWPVGSADSSIRIAELVAGSNGTPANFSASNFTPFQQFRFNSG